VLVPGRRSMSPLTLWRGQHHALRHPGVGSRPSPRRSLGHHVGRGSPSALAATRSLPRAMRPMAQGIRVVVEATVNTDQRTDRRQNTHKKGLATAGLTRDFAARRRLKEQFCGAGGDRTHGRRIMRAPRRRLPWPLPATTPPDPLRVPVVPPHAVRTDSVRSAPVDARSRASRSRRGRRHVGARPCPRCASLLPASLDQLGAGNAGAHRCQGAC
jgi:hypothetical protein